MRVFLAILLLVLATGCAVQQPLVYEKSGATMQDFRQDTYQCVQDSRTTWAAGGHWVHVLAARNEAQVLADRLYKMCMEAHGYTTRPQQPGEIIQR
jgi:hypothetical protein